MVDWKEKLKTHKTPHTVSTVTDRSFKRGRDEDYWRSKLAGHKASSFPETSSRSSGQTRSSANRVEDFSSSSVPSGEATVDFQATSRAMRGLIRDRALWHDATDASTDSSTDPGRNSPTQIPPLNRDILRRLLSKETNVPSITALYIATRLAKAVDDHDAEMDRIAARMLNPDSEIRDISDALHSLECSIRRTQTQLGEVVQAEHRVQTAAVLNGARTKLRIVEDKLHRARQAYPDTSPYRVDNSKVFLDSMANRQDSTKIAQIIGLVNRVFDGVSQRCASVTLQLVKLYGLALILEQPEGPTLSQQNAISDVPERVETLEGYLNLDIESVPYAVCPGCHYLHPPSRLINSSKHGYPDQCTKCNTAIVEDGKHMKLFHYYPFLQWFGRFLSIPGIEDHCEAFYSEAEMPQTSDRTHRSDGSYVREFLDANGNLFISQRGNEGRWLWKLHADYFNIETNRIAGAQRSTGLIALTCLNLPHKLANDPACVYVVGLIEGPHEPSTTAAAHSYYLGPLMDDMEVAYMRGITLHSTHNSRRSGVDIPYQIIHRLAIINAIMDLKAARPFAGLRDASAHNFCFVCTCWHKAHMGRTDFENWEKVDDDYLRDGALRWKDAEDLDEKGSIEQIYGTRWSELWRLPYWKPSRQLVVDPMHTIFLLLEQNYFRVALRLNDPPLEARTDLLSSVAYRYDFTPPPHPSTLMNTGSKRAAVTDKVILELLKLGDDEQDDLQILEWHKTGSSKNLRDARADDLKKRIEGPDCKKEEEIKSIVAIHATLSAAAPSSPQEKSTCLDRLKRQRWAALAYVCNDLMVFPTQSIRRQSTIEMGDSTKENMANVLLDWRLNDIHEQEEYQWPFFTWKTSGHPSLPSVASRDDFDESPDTVMAGNNLDITTEECGALLKTLGSVMNYRSATGIGQIHTKLQEPLINTEKGQNTLVASLGHTSVHALAYVCIDLHILPRQFKKADLIQQLLIWRLGKPLDAISAAAFHEKHLLDRIHFSIRNICVPTWVTKPPDEVGLKVAGKLKADEWRTLFAIYLPLVVLSMWGSKSPLVESTDAAARMASVLETTMALVCAVANATKRRLTIERRNKYRECLRKHIRGLQTNFPDFLRTSHHLAFHVFDFMDSFSAIRYWWAFPFEHLIGRMQRIPINHQTGKQEKSLLQSFYRGAFFRQSLLRSESSPLLAYCQELIDDAYGYNVDGDDSYDPQRDSTVVDNGMPQESSSAPQVRYIPANSIPEELVRLVGGDIQCISRVNASRGHYSIPNPGSPGNSYVCFWPQDNRNAEWEAGRIKYIYEKQGHIYLVIRRSKRLRPDLDPFKSYWHDGFEAFLVSPEFEDELETVGLERIIAHTARWDLDSEHTVVLSLSKD